MKKATFLGSLLAAFVLGGAGMWAWQQHRAEAPATLASATIDPGTTTVPGSNPLMAQPDPMLNDPRLGDPIRQLEHMHRRMERMLNRDFFGPAGFFGHPAARFSTAGMDFGTSIQESEDEHSVFYTVKVGDKDSSKVNVSVENGYVSINAEITDKTANAYAQSSMSQSFPVPAGVDPDSARVDQKGDSVVISFDKLS